MAAVDLEAPGEAKPARPRAVGYPAQAADLPEGFWYSVKRRVLGPPLLAASAPHWS